MPSEAIRGALPAAVLAGFVILAAAVWRGAVAVSEAIAARKVAESSIAPAPTTASLASSVPPAAMTAPATASLSPELLAHDREVRITEQAQEALHAQQAHYAGKCSLRVLDPSAREPMSRYGVVLNFGGDGRETKREIRADMGSNERVLECLKRQRMPALAIPPPGSPITVRTTLMI